MSMGDELKAQYSRDGDQFHYWWATRKCLKLLIPESDLVSVTIEGPSFNETESRAVSIAEEIVDVGEYYGAESLADARLIKYIQLKHSTAQEDKDFTISDLKKTLAKFAERFLEAFAACPQVVKEKRLLFSFTTNRPIKFEIKQLVEQCAMGVPITSDSLYNYLCSYTKLTADKLSTFCELLELKDSVPSWQEQESLAYNEAARFLSSRDADATLQLKELITQKATTKYKSDPHIRSTDVLQRLGVEEDELFPCKNKITAPTSRIERTCYQEIVEKILTITEGVSVVEADGGVGKTVFTTCIGKYLPKGSVNLVYDCFGNGQYRNLSKSRHRHKDAFVQMANELATMALCDPLIPSRKSDNKDFIASFMKRVQSSITALRLFHPSAFLFLTIDAADNAQIAAKDFGEHRAFIKDLIREEFPEGVKLVVTARPYRVELLDISERVLKQSIPEFSLEETQRHVKSFVKTVDHSAFAEFHRLSSQNPRVQSWALDSVDSLEIALSKFGNEATSVSDTLFAMLESAIETSRISSKSDVVRLCSAIAILPPLIPLKLLSQVTDLPPSMIQSFIADLKTPLILVDGFLHFCDEPAEEWFRTKYEKSAIEFEQFIHVIENQASKSAYASAILPMLLYRAGKLEHLIQLALSKRGLPEEPSVEATEIRYNRLQFALKSSLKAERYSDSIALAFQLGGATAGDGRLTELLQKNTDIAGLALEPSTVQQFVAKRKFSSVKNWLGDYHIYDASLQSMHPSLAMDALSSLRMALSWFEAKVRRDNDANDTTDENEKNLSRKDVVNLAWAHVKLNRVAGAAQLISRWKSPLAQYYCTQELVQLFVTHQYHVELIDFVIQADVTPYMVLAALAEVVFVPVEFPIELISKTILFFISNDTAFSVRSNRIDRNFIQENLVVVSFYAKRYALVEESELISFCDKHFPHPPQYDPTSVYSSFRDGIFRCCAIKSALHNRDIVIEDILPPSYEDKKFLSQRDSQELSSIKHAVEPVLPYYELWASLLVGNNAGCEFDELVKSVDEQTKSRLKRTWGELERTCRNEIAQLTIEILILSNGLSSKSKNILEQWFVEQENLTIPTLIQVTKYAAHLDAMHEVATFCSEIVFSRLQNDDENSASTANFFVKLARAVFPYDSDEALEYFRFAQNVSEYLGEETLWRWEAVLGVANQRDMSQPYVPQLAFRLSQAAELTHNFYEDHFPWKNTLAALVRCCPNSTFSILSRWQDRNVGLLAEQIPYLIEILYENKVFKFEDVVPFLKIRGYWAHSVFFKDVINSKLPIHITKELISMICQSLLFDSNAGASIGDFEEQLKGIGLYSELERAINNSKCFEGIELASSDDRKDKQSLSVTIEDTTDVECIRRSYELADIPSYDRRAFWAAAFKQVKHGKEARSLQALYEALHEDYSAYWVISFLKEIPENWFRKLSVRRATSELVERCCATDSLEFIASARFGLELVMLAARLTEKDEKSYLSSVLVSIVDQAHPLDSHQAFCLVNVLAFFLKQDEVDRTIESCLTYYDTLPNASYKDGDWNSRLVPPQDMMGSVAGFLWALLASPDAKRRWEAAHVVRALLKFRRVELIDRVVSYALGQSSVSSFHDNKFIFHHDSAVLWLLLAMKKGVEDDPTPIARYASELQCFADSDHALIRSYAAAILCSLYDKGECVELESQINKLKNINVSSYPVVTKTKGRHERTTLLPSSADYKSNFLLYGMDFGRTFVDSLGSLFGIPQVQLEEYCDKIILEHWQVDRDRLKDLPSRNYFKTRDYYDRGSFPELDSARHYLAFNAVMIAAGRLFAIYPLFKDSYSEDDNIFLTWLKDYAEFNPDMGWRADLRSQTPCDVTYSHNIKDEDWLDCLSIEDFKNVLTGTSQKIVLGGNWDTRRTGRYEHVSIRCALVSSRSSEALLRAFNSTQSRYDIGIPYRDERSEISYDKYQLLSFLTENDLSERKIDKYDPWAGNLPYVLLSPADFVQNNGGIFFDNASSCWRTIKGEERFLETFRWGYEEFATHSGSGGSCGHRVESNLSSLLKVLSSVEMDLIIEVHVVRRFAYSSWQKEKYGESNSDQSYKNFRCFLIKADGCLYT